MDERSPSTLLAEAIIKSRIDVVIVHYPCADDLRVCVESIAAFGEKPASITIVDNASPDGVPAGLSADPGIEVVSQPKNVGFARAANRGARLGDAPLLLFLNPDVMLRRPTLQALTSAAGGNGVVAAAPRLILPDGRTQTGSSGYFPALGALTTHALQVPEWIPGKWSKRPLFWRESNGHNGNADSRPPQPVDWISAACLLIQRDAFEAIGGFDERFFMYGEDIDLCLRLRKRGWQVRYCPSAPVEHRHVAMSNGSSSRAPADTWLEGLDQYYRLHCAGSRRLLHAVFGLGFSLRSVAYASRLAKPRSTGSGASRRLAAFARRSFRLALAG